MEEELLLVDPETGDPRAVSAAVLARAERDTSSPDFEKELHSQMLEFATHPQSRLDALHREIVRCREEAARHAGETGATVAALATSPLPAGPRITVNHRYRWMADHYGLPVHEQLVCGCHVHVSVDSADEGVAVLDRIRPWLPVLTAFSANSPFWQGKESGYDSYRSRVWSRWPSAGPTELFGSADEYERRVSAMVDTGVLLDRKMVYFDARLSEAYPTVEIRVADVCLHADTPVLIAALCRALVETAAREWRDGVAAVPHSVSLLRLAGWQASHAGLSGTLLHPVTMEPAPAREVVDALTDHVGAALRDTGDLERVRETTALLFERGNGARVQREVWARTGNLHEVVLECVRATRG